MESIPGTRRCLITTFILYHSAHRNSCVLACVRARVIAGPALRAALRPLPAATTPNPARSSTPMRPDPPFSFPCTSSSRTGNTEGARGSAGRSACVCACVRECEEARNGSKEEARKRCGKRCMHTCMPSNWVCDWVRAGSVRSVLGPWRVAASLA